MTNTQLVARKLSTLAEYCARARRRRPDDFQVLAGNAELQDALGMALLVAIQEAIDMAFHVCTDERWGAPSSYAESFDLLARHGVITDDLAGAMVRATGLRNRLAHGYASVDLSRLWTAVPEGLDALEAFGQSVAALVASR